MATAPAEPDCVRTRSIRALLLVLAPATVASAPLGTFGRVPYGPWLPVAAIAALLALAGLGHRARGRGLRLAATVALLAWAVGTLLEHLDSPGRGLVVLVGAVSAVAFTWPRDRLRRFAAEQGLHHEDQGLRVSSGVAALFGLDHWLTAPQPTAVEALGLTLAYAVPVVLAWRQGAAERPLQRVALGAAAFAALAPALDVGLRLGGGAPTLAAVGLASPCVVLALTGQRAALRWLAPGSPTDEPGLLDLVLIHPSRVLVVSFVALCAVGTLLLGLPVASATGEELPWLDAAFTAVSATCVTGLSVVDTSRAFGPAGQLFVLLLIQVGGLGIMAFSAAAMVLLGRRLSLSHERAAVDLVGAPGRAGLVRAIRGILVVTAATEGFSALLLFLGFLARGDRPGMALWRAVFTSISAFCNAGFALQTDSLVPYADSPFVLAVVGVTVIIGGLGPPVVAALTTWRDPHRRTLHVKLVLWTTAILLFVPAALIAALEWDGTLAGLGPVDKISNALFQSITLRTAGFNSIDLARVHPATWTVMVLLMFVGGSPGSTAGGVKTTTVAVVILAIAAIVRGREQPEVFGRTLPTITVVRATAVLTLGALGACVALAAIQLTQTLPLDVALFEVVSALATVGLTTGGTASLDEVGRLIVMACMFAGRVGPLTLFVFLASNARRRAARRYPEEPVPIG